jgi:intein/homing endonuclease
VYTRHQDTFEWGNYKVTSAERYIQPTVKVVIDEFQVEVSASHKFLTKDLEFVSISDLLVGDLIETTKGVKPILSIESTGTKEVVKLEIEDAHTYVVENIVSHNKLSDGPDTFKYL